MLWLASSLCKAEGPPPTVSTDQFARTVLTDQALRYEGEIAALMEKQGEPNDLGVPLLNLQIDVRILCRWMIARSAEAAPGSDLQICTFLRRALCFRPLVSFSQKIQNSRDPLSRGQLDALKVFHELTYKLPEAKDGGKIDELCHALSVALFAAAGPLSGTEKNIPIMRPQVMEDDVAFHAAAATVADGSGRARAEDLGVHALRRQLIALAAAAADPQPTDAGPA